MQTYAEEAMDEHLLRLQKEFDAQNVNNKTAPFRDITPEETEQIIKSAMRRSDRWRKLAKQGKEKEEIVESFSKKNENANICLVWRY
jgi:penicillin-binding protein 1A